MARAMPIAMTSALAWLIDQSGIGRLLSGYSARAAIDAEVPRPRDWADRAVQAIELDPDSVSPAEAELAVRGYLWRLLSAVWLLLAVAVAVVYLVSGREPLPASGAGRYAYLPVALTTAVSLSNSICAVAIASGHYPSTRHAQANAIWAGISLGFFVVLLSAYLPA